MNIVSFSRYGYEGEIIKIEADLRRGIPAIDIVGLPDGAVREARERMRAAIRNSGFEFPRDRILINLSPADLKKEGSSFDLPIALAVLNAAEDGETSGEGDRTVMVFGELELSGAVRPVRGILSGVSRGLSGGIRHFIVPDGNLAEAAIRDEACVIGVKNLLEAVAALRALKTGDSPETGDLAAGGTLRGETVREESRKFAPDIFPDGNESFFEDVKGQPILVRALEIAAAGGHHLIAYGPPGCGKTLAIQRIRGILPNMDGDTALVATRIHSIAGTLPDESALLIRPQFREPHASASVEGMTGGGKKLGPGEISLAHGGVLFLDEASQFRASVLQALRAPLETGTVTVSRAGKAATYPARFQLLMAMNPCPCGNYGAPNAVCTCAPDAIEKYWRRLAAPLIDRIDLRIAVMPPSPDELAAGTGFSTEALRKEIGTARRMQWERAGTGESEWLNARLSAAGIERHCALGERERKLFVRCMEARRLSGRSGHGILKVARTIADLAGKERIEEDHVLEAAQLRHWGAFVPDFLREDG